MTEKKTDAKERCSVLISTDKNNLLAKEFLKQQIPKDILVKYNFKQILHAHSYGGLSKFFTQLRKGTLMGTICRDCGGVEGNIWLPPRVHCPDCWKNMSWIPINPDGAKVYTYSMANYPGAGFKGSVPCPLISVEIPGVSTKFMSYLSKFGENEPYIGMPIKPVFRKKDPTHTILDVSWVPLDEDLQ
jgi:uncharacterized OB-fold protein